MSARTIEKLYHRHIESIPVSEQLQLIVLISQHLAKNSAEPVKTKTRSLLELEGLGAEIWKGIDAQEYVHKEKESWD